MPDEIEDKSAPSLEPSEVNSAPATEPIATPEVAPVLENTPPAPRRQLLGVNIMKKLLKKKPTKIPSLF